MKARKPRIVVLGSINMDLVAVAPSLPTPGETVMGDRFRHLARWEGGESGRRGRPAGCGCPHDWQGRVTMCSVLCCLRTLKQMAWMFRTW